MIKKIAAVVAIAAAMSVAVTIAQASTTTSHHVDLTGDGAGIGHSPFTSSGPPGSKGTFAGTLGASGAIIEKQVYKVGVQTSFGGTVRVFGLQGTYSGKITSGTTTVPMGGPPQQTTEKVKITAGSRLYKGATGTLKITHTLIPGSPAFYKVVVKGTINY